MCTFSLFSIILTEYIRHMSIITAYSNLTARNREYWKLIYPYFRVFNKK